jgi:zinc transport system substrate-binding protein
MIKRWAVVLLCLAAVVSFSACGTGSSQTDTGKLKVSVTFNAMKEFVEAVGQDKVEVTAIIPDGTEAHGFEPKAQDLVSLSTAKVFVYNGLGMEGWVEEAIGAANNANLIVVDASEGADVIERDTDADDHHEDADHHEEAEHDEDANHAEDAAHEEEHEEEGHHHGKYDPHLWIGIKGAQTQVQNIKTALIKADPENKDFYEKNCESFVSQLESLYNEYSAKFQSAEKKNFVTGHAAFGYLCRDFGLVQSSVSDVFAEGEPSAQQLSELVEYCRVNNVTTIFAEEMASPAVSETLANEVGAKVQTIYTMETNEDGKTYLERMEENLAKIYESLMK